MMDNPIIKLRNRISRKWKSIKIQRKNFVDKILLKMHSLKPILNSTKTEHIIICGPDSRGSSALHQAIRNCTTSKTYSPGEDISALNTLNIFKKSIITHEPMDLFSVSDIQELLSDFRNVKFIVVVKDPRKLLTEVHDNVSWQYYQSWDYGFYESPHLSFTRPGVGKAFDEIDQLKEADDTQYMLIRYEDFLARPDEIQDEISGFADITFGKAFSDYLSNTNKDVVSQTNTEQSIDSWKETKHAHRLKTLYQLFPEINERIKEYDYPKDEELKKRYNLPNIDFKSVRGTIVAFHTDDKTYINEAARCRKRLEQLGLPHDFTTVSKSGSWVENCALKPEFLLGVRKRIRGPLLYIDVDAFVHSDPWPYLTDYDGDMAAYIHGDGELISCTLLLNDTETTESLLKEWVHIQKKKPKTYDQKVLQDIIEEDEKSDQKYRFQRLPLNFSYINDKQYPYIFGDPIIEQLQASRIAKSGKRGEKMSKRVDELNAIYSIN